MNNYMNFHFDLFDKGNAPAAEPSSKYLLAGFTPEQVMDLFYLRRAVTQGRYSETTQESRRLMFARWLVEHGRLDG